MHMPTHAHILAFTPDGRTLAAGMNNGLVVLCHVATGQELGTLDAGEGLIKELRFATDGQALAAVVVDKPTNLDAAVFLWSCRSRSP